MRKIYPLLAVLTVSSWAHAQDYSFLPEAKLADHKSIYLECRRRFYTKIVTSQW